MSCECRQLIHYKRVVEAYARKQNRNRKHRDEAGEGDTTAAVDFITSMVIRAMNEARYVCSESTSSSIVGERDIDKSSQAKDNTAVSLHPGKRFEHFGLGLSYYTHYTSPIRRYADIIVHRYYILVFMLTTKLIIS